MKKQHNRNNDNQLIIEVLHAMQPKIKKSLQNTSFQEQEDLKQEIYIKVIHAVKTRRIQPLTLWEFKEKFDKKAYQKN
ncbi:MAG: helix-turn-helix domain-containing protein [Carnobacterium sp.]|nr:helix-turn-helix domain-containing protein [Carnobacterium sp.]